MLKGVKEENTKLKEENAKLTTENEKLTKANTDLKTEKERLTKANTDLTDKNKALTTEKDNLNTDLSKIKNQAIQAKEEKDKLEQKCTLYEKLEKLYEVFLEVKGCLGFGFVEKPIAQWI
nr:hypothetical protein [Helicobacter pylori]